MLRKNTELDRKFFENCKDPISLNGRELVERGILTNIPSEPSTLEKHIQQVGFDLSLMHVEKLDPTCALQIGADDSELPRIFPSRKTVELQKTPISDELPDAEVWVLEQGAYDITFFEGLNPIPANFWLQIRQRSTLLRGAAIIVSSVFDPGFSTQHIGTMLFVLNPAGMVVEKGARVGQIISMGSRPVNRRDLYGQELKGSSYQHDRQRNQP